MLRATKTRAVRPAAALVLALAAAAPAAGRALADKEVVGWVQNVAFEPGGLVLKAKMDSGAKTSSLNVSRIQSFSRDGRRWVRFQVTNGKGRAAVFERPVLRDARIKRRNGRAEDVPVVELEICLGGIRKRTEVGLNDRGGFNYQLLVGRRFLAGDFLIDPGRTFLAPPHCGGGAAANGR